MNSWCKIISIKETTHCSRHLQGHWKICIWIDCNDKNITILSLSQTGKSIASSVTLSCWLRTINSELSLLELLMEDFLPYSFGVHWHTCCKKHLSVPKPKGQGYYLYNNKNFFKKNSYDSRSSRVLSLKQFLLKKKDQFPSLRLLSHEAISVKTLSPHFTSLIERNNTNNYMHHSAL